jgi:hypothetical protein
VAEESENRAFFFSRSIDAEAVDVVPFAVRAGDISETSDSIAAYPPLVQMGGTAIYPTAGPSQVAITPRSGSAVPDVDVRLNRDMWNMTTVGLGFAVGGVIGHVPGAIIGGVTGYGLGRFRWAQVQKNRHYP